MVMRSSLKIALKTSMHFNLYFVVLFVVIEFPQTPEDDLRIARAVRGSRTC